MSKEIEDFMERVKIVLPSAAEEILKVLQTKVRIVFFKRHIFKDKKIPSDKIPPSILPKKGKEKVM
jgi:hypothetical protein